MAEAVAEPQTAPVVEKQEATNGTNDTSKEVSKNGAEVSDKKQSNGKRDREEDEDDYERYDHGKSDKREKRDRDDRRGRDGDRKGGGRGWARGGGRGRGGRGGGGRGGGRGGFDRDNRNYRKDNVRTKYERQEESNDAAEIRRQVEFYFSSSNLPVDRFLLEETGGPENKWFSLKTLHNFKRMRHFQPYSAVVEAVKGSDLVEINDKDEIRRKVPIDSKFTLDVKKNNEILTTETMKRSIYAKGFGEEHSKTAFEVEEFFNPYGAKAVRLRRAEDGTFKGSAFIEFGSEDDAQQFLDMEEKPKFNEKELNIMGKKAYVDMKSQGILDGTVKPKSPTRQGDFRRGNNQRGNHGHGNRKPRRNSFDYGDNKRKRDKDDDDVEDKDDWRSRRDKFQKKRDGSVTRSRSRSPYHAEKSDEKPVEENKAKPAAKSEEKPADKGEEKPAEKSEDKLAEKSEDEPVEKTETVDPPAAENVAEASEVSTNA